MESQSVVERMSQSCYRQSLIEAKAESCIKYPSTHTDATRCEPSSTLGLDHLIWTWSKTIRILSWLNICFNSRAAAVGWKWIFARESMNSFDWRMRLSSLQRKLRLFSNKELTSRLKLLSWRQSWKKLRTRNWTLLLGVRVMSMSWTACGRTKSAIKYAGTSWSKN